MNESMRGMDFWGVAEELNVEKMKNEIFLNPFDMPVYDEIWWISSRNDVLSDLYYNEASKTLKKHRNLKKYISKNHEVKNCL